MKAVRIIIIAKEPSPGLAKTRLIPALGADGAAQLADRLLKHTLEQALTAAIGPVELCVAPDSRAPYWQQLPMASEVELSQQVDGDLGHRMAAAAQHGLANGIPVMLIGTDCPALEAAQLRAMAASLHSHDACLCPVSDGGYSLLGLHRLDPSVFRDIPWSTSDVAGLTRRKFHQLGWRWHESRPLSDIDEPHDLEQLARHYPELAGSA